MQAGGLGEDAESQEPGSHTMVSHQKPPSWLIIIPAYRT